LHLVIYSAGFLPKYGGAELYAYNIGKSMPSDYQVTILTRAVAGQKTSDKMGNLQISRLKPYLIPFYLPILNLKNKINILQVNLPGYETAALWVFAKILRIPCLLTYHGSQESSKKDAAIYASLKIQYLMQWLFLSRLVWDRIVCVDEHGLAELTHKLNKKASRMRLVPPGIDSSKFNPQKTRNTLKKYRGNPVILCPRRVDPKNGIHYLLLAIAKLKNTYPDVTLLIAGRTDSSYESYLSFIKRLINENKLGESVVFLGSVPYDDMPVLYQNVDIVVIPSLAEARSLAAQEAMACGKPVIATNVGGLPEIIEDKKNGLLVTPRNPQAIFEAILTLILNPALAESLAESAAHTALSNAWAYRSEEYTNIYEELLG
jgi:glycosyltransferase involved in cell wall biosynthesis